MLLWARARQVAKQGGFSVEVCWLMRQAKPMLRFRYKWSAVGPVDTWSYWWEVSFPLSLLHTELWRGEEEMKSGELREQKHGTVQDRWLLWLERNVGPVGRCGR